VVVKWRRERNCRLLVSLQLMMTFRERERERERDESTFSTARQKQMTVSILGQALQFLSA
jgi:hypothetical protein